MPNSQLFFPIWIIIVLMYSIWETSFYKSFSRSVEQFFLTVGQNNFGNKIPFLYSLTYWIPGLLAQYKTSKEMNSRIATLSSCIFNTLPSTKLNSIIFSVLRGVEPIKWLFRYTFVFPWINCCWSQCVKRTSTLM